MKNMKKILALLLCLTMALGMFPAAFADDGIELAGDEALNLPGIEEVAGDDALGVPEAAESSTGGDQGANPSDESVGDDALGVPQKEQDGGQTAKTLIDSALLLEDVATYEASGWNNWNADGTLEEQLIACATAQVGKTGPNLGLPSTDWCARFIVAVAERVGLGGTVFPSSSWSKTYKNSKGDYYGITYAWGLGQALLQDFGARVIEEGEDPKKGDIIVYNGSHIEIITKDNNYFYSVGGNVYPSMSAQTTQVYQHTPTAYCADGNGNKYPRSKIVIIRPAYTPPSPYLTVTAYDAASVTANNATLNGFIHFGNYQPTQWGVDCGTSSSNLPCVIFDDSGKQVISSSGTGCNVSFNFVKDAQSNPLQANTTYYYRFWVKYGNNQYVHSEVKSFTTGSPAALTPMSFSNVCAKDGDATGSAATTVNKDTAILYSTLSYASDNKPDYWNLYLGPSSSQLSKVQLKSGINTFTDTILNNNYPNVNIWADFKTGQDVVTPALQAGTTYYYQFEVISRNGQSYRSEVKSFKTSGTATTYTVTFDANGGSGAPAGQIKTKDVSLTLSGSEPGRSGTSGSYTVTLSANGGTVSVNSLTAPYTTSYIFKGWNTAADGSGTSYAPGADYTANSSVILYAQWDSSTTVQAVTLPTPTKEGFDFKGWYNASQNRITGSYTPTGDVKLYAAWEIIMCKIVYYKNDGTGSYNIKSVTYGNTHTVSTAIPTRKDIYLGSFTIKLNANGGSVSPAAFDAERTTSYTFTSWNTEADGSGRTYQPGDSYKARASLDLYAQWNSITTTQEIELPTPTRSGFIFKGWATSSGAASGVTGSYTPSGNVTLYAVWAGPDFVLPAALTTIDAEAFAGGAFSYVKLSDKTTSIGARAFADCPNLRYVYIPEATTGIAGDAFSGVDGLTILGRSGSYAEFFAQKNGYAFDATE